MILTGSIRPLCASCRTSNPTSSSATVKSYICRRLSSSSTSIPPSGKAAPKRIPTRRSVTIGLLGLSLPLSYFFFPSSNQLSPYKYSEQKVSSSIQISNQHKLVSVPIPNGSKELFLKPFRRDGSIVQEEEGEVVIQHLMFKSPDIQIERPYTPINDPVQDGEVRIVVKRVRGGEVGRVIHSVQAGETLGVRGPIPTCSLIPGEYDKIIMISTGTGIAPFLQLLSKIPPPSSSISKAPQLHLIHSLPLEGRPDWVSDTQQHNDASFLPSLHEKFGPNLIISRPPQGYITKDILLPALSSPEKENEKTLVLICLPPPLMRPLCGNMTPNLDQGPLTGLLAEMGLSKDQVYKLE